MASSSNLVPRTALEEHNADGRRANPENAGEEQQAADYGALAGLDGLPTLARWVHEINERDLGAMWRIERLREAVDAAPAGGAHHQSGLLH